MHPALQVEAHQFSEELQFEAQTEPRPFVPSRWQLPPADVGLPAVVGPPAPVAEPCVELHPRVWAVQFLTELPRFAHPF